jgi:hypothetical protein
MAGFWLKISSLNSWLVLLMNKTSQYKYQFGGGRGESDGFLYSDGVGFGSDGFLYDNRVGVGSEGFLYREGVGVGSDGLVLIGTGVGENACTID